jgi:CRISPR-associated protein Csx16
LSLQRGDRDFGSLPANLAADICDKGARYLHLTIDFPSEAARGKNLGADEMDGTVTLIEKLQAECP